MSQSVQVLPSNEVIELSQLADLMSTLEDERQALRPFHSSVLEFCESLARSLRENKAIRSKPALAALAWWLRPSSLSRLQDHWEKLSNSPNTLRVPRGIVFHIPPTNVETILVYSWICSLLAGNANVIRISSASSSEDQMLLTILFETISKFPVIARTNIFVKYAHDPEISEILSRSDVRAIWGGDSTVSAIKQVPASPRSIDIPFSNRFSFSVLSSDAIREATSEEMKQLAHNFVNDSYWFDQVACSSPKLFFLLQPDEVHGDEPLRRLIGFLISELENKKIEVAASISMAKLVNSFSLAADGLVTSIHRPNHRITIGEISQLGSFPRDMPGGGLFYTARIKSLQELSPFIDRADQTLTHFGIPEPQLRSFIESLNGRGIDRVVPVGEALSFDVVWDGFDLFDSFSKLVHLKS